MSAEDKEKVDSAVKVTLDWLEKQDTLPEVSDCEVKQKELEEILHPIVTKLYQESGEEPKAD